MIVRPEILSACKRRPIVFSDGSLDHRGMAIRLGCDLEAELIALLVAHDVKHEGKSAAHSLKKREEKSLKELANIAHDLLYVSEAERIDIRQLAELRNRYAHDKKRAQLDDDEEMFALIRETALYRDTPELAAFERQQALMAIGRELCARLQESAGQMARTA